MRRKFDHWLTRFNNFRWEVKLGVIAAIATVIAAIIGGIFVVIGALITRPDTSNQNTPPIQIIVYDILAITQTAVAGLATLTPLPTATPTKAPTLNLTLTKEAESVRATQLAENLPTNTSLPTATATSTPTMTLTSSATPTANLALTAAMSVSQTAVGTRIMIDAESTLQARFTQTAKSKLGTLSPTPTALPTIDGTATQNAINTLVLTPTASVGVVSVNPATIRSSPGIKNYMVTRVPIGTRVLVIEQSDIIESYLWYHIKTVDGLEGWIREDLLRLSGTLIQNIKVVPQSTLVYLPVSQNNQWFPLIKIFDGIEMVLVPPGCFDMSSVIQSNDPAINRQCIQKPFWIDRTEVTLEAYYNQRTSRNPIEGVSWDDADKFCRGRGVEVTSRLPTELEWEYAARGPSNWTYPWGNDFISANLVYSTNHKIRISQSKPVGSIPQGASWVGAVDMSGNVWEWVSTVYIEELYTELYTENFDRQKRDEKQLHVHHGGAYYNDEIEFMNPIHRGFGVAETQYVGFRCARDFQTSDLLN